MKNRVAALSKKQSVHIDHDKRIVYLLAYPAQPDLGNKSWGTIDYLTNQGGYNLEKVTELPRKRWETTAFTYLIPELMDEAHAIS